MAKRRHVFISPHKEHVCKVILARVFNGLFFASQQRKKILYASYAENMRSMILYALDNDLNPYEYIAGIKEELLRSQYVRQK